MTKADLINAIAEKGEYSKKDADKGGTEGRRSCRCTGQP